MLIFTQPKGQTKGQKTFFGQNLFQLMYNHKLKSKVPLWKKHKSPDRKGGEGVNPYGQPDRKISVFLLTTSLMDHKTYYRITKWKGLGTVVIDEWLLPKRNSVWVLFQQEIHGNWSPHACIVQIVQILSWGTDGHMHNVGAAQRSNYLRECLTPSVGFLLPIWPSLQ